MKRSMQLFLVFTLVFCGTAFAGSLPDTGQTKCYDNNVRIPCPLPGEAFYGQDAQYVKARSYTKLDSSGNALPDSAASWVMVKDNVTGLIWEVKNAMDGTKDYNNPNDADNTYTWYNPDLLENKGTPGDGTDTDDFIKKLNSTNFGGHNDWRLPTVKELQTLVDRGKTSAPYIHTGYFPSTQSYAYWTSTSYAGGPASAWHVHFVNGSMFNLDQVSSFYVRAVRSGQ